MRLLFIGPPGVGKGTQGARLSQALGVPLVSTGELLRRLIASGEETPLVRAAREIEGGAFVSDAFANQLAFSALAAPEAAGGFVLDGYPRSVPQAEALGEFLEGLGLSLDAVVVFSISRGALAERLQGRRVCPTCARTYHVTAAPSRLSGLCEDCGVPLVPRVEDNSPAKIALRQALYEERTAPVIAYYRQQGLVKVVSAEADPKTVFGFVCESLRILI